MGTPNRESRLNLYYSFYVMRWKFAANVAKMAALALLLFAAAPLAKEWKVDPTWLHRYVPEVAEKTSDVTTDSCHSQPIFGEGDPEAGILRSVARFGEVTVDAGGECKVVRYERQEEIYFVLKGSGTLHYGPEQAPMRKNDFTYLPPGVSHTLSNPAQEPLRVVVMGVKIPADVAIQPAVPKPAIANLDQVKEQTVEGHPVSVQYKLLIGPRTGTRDLINATYVVIDTFLMDFAPGGTNFPHHHLTAEEIYLVLDGEGSMVAGGGMDGTEGRHAARAGDAYYFRPNCTVGFYNSDRPGAKAHILALRSRVPLPKRAD
ncbi:MAG TPA: cupin domain-containing protein [Terriglobia bacterium]|nr:cupin domain-containing protein [Terriglobia bacterium]